MHLPLIAIMASILPLSGAMLCAAETPAAKEDAGTVITNPCWTVTAHVKITARDTFAGSPRLRFTVQGLNATMALPTGPAPAGTRPWLWYAPLGFGAGQEWIFQPLMAAGFTIVCINAGETMGNPGGRLVFQEFYKFMVTEFHLSPKACLSPQSRGGLMLYNWAEDHPDCVQCIGGIYPVCDMACWPGLKDRNLQCAFGMGEDELKEHLPEHNPIERLAVLAARKIPILHVTGDSDTTVPMEKHSLEMQKRYRALGGDMEVEIIPGKGHAECPEIFHSQKLLDFFLKHGR